MNIEQFYSQQISAAAYDLLQEPTTSAHKLPSKLAKLLAAAGMDRAPAGTKLDQQRVSEILASKGMSITDRMTAKFALAQAGLL